MSDLESWKGRLDLTNEDVLTPGHLHRVATQGPAQESEIIYCACGCGEFWLRPIVHVDRKRRYVQGHAPRRRRKRKIRIPIPKKDEIVAVYRALRAREWTVTEKIAERTGFSKDRCEMLLGFIDIVLSGPRLEVVKVGRMTGYRKEGS